MNCPNCQAANPDGAKFCMNCGQSLGLTCPNCQTELPASAAFCYNCGHQIGKPVQETPAPAPGQGTRLERYIPKELLSKLRDARDSQAMAGERRIVTMLFCDVGGSTAAAAQLDPEEWTEIINGAFEHLIAPVYRYEGTVARLMGDGILAFFGAPIAHEDDPQRAVLASLEILQSIKPYSARVRKSWGFDLNVRVGINTGLVVVGAVGSDMRMEYTALGDAINIAARMEQAAAPGTVQIAEATHKLIAPLFEFEDLGGIEVKGKDAPVRAYRVLNPRAEPGRLRGIEGLEAPLIGRGAEMQTLRQALLDLQQGRGQILSMIGEAGLGKSRIMAELRRTSTPVSNTDAPLTWLEGRSLSYQSSTPYAPFIALFEEYFQLTETLSEEDKYSQVAASVEQVMPGRSDEVAPFIATLLGIGLSGSPLERIKYLEPPQVRERTFLSVSSFFEALAATGPLVLVIDDLHWADPTSLELLEQLLPVTDRTMLIVIVLFRPRREEPSYDFYQLAEREYAHRHTAIRLEPLPEDNARELVANLLHVEDLPLDVRNLILSKAEGNPFFVEEVIRSLLDARLIVRHNGRWRATREIVEIAVPDTLTAVITTRLDRLDDEARRAAQTAAVIGREFNYETLASLYGANDRLEQALTELQRRELIWEASRIPQRRYLFKHALTQETAYNSLLLKNRRVLHKRVGELLAGQAPERVNEIARHFLDGGERARALPYLVAAGDRAARAYATREAIGYYEQALEILPQGDELELSRRAFEGLGSALTFANDVPRAIQTYQQMLEQAKAKGDMHMQVSALNKMSYVTALRLGEFQKAETYITEADQLARESDDTAGLSELSLIRCMMCTAVADFDGVVRYMDETVSIGRQLAEKEQMSMGLAHIASSQIFMLQFEEGWETLQEGLALSREIGDREHEADHLASIAPIYHMRNGDLASARSTAQEGVGIAKNIGSVNIAAQGLRVLGILDQIQGDYEQAIHYLTEYLNTGRKAGLPFLEAEALCRLGSVFLEISPALVDRMLDFHVEAVKLLESPVAMMLGGSSWAELGFCAQALGKTEDARQLFEKGLTTPTITTNIERPRLFIGMARVALAHDNPDEAAHMTEEARQLIQKHGMKNYEALLELTAAQVAAARGNVDEALATFEQAEMIARDMSLRPHVWRASAGMAELLDAAGKAEQANTRRQAARVMIEEIGSLFQSEELRNHYLEHALKMLNGEY